MLLTLSLLSLACFDPDAGTRSPLARAGDLNGDGVPDLWVAGPCPILHGTAKAGRLPEETIFGHVFALSGADGALLWRIEGERQRDFFGFSIAGGRDFDGDRVPDLLVAAPGKVLFGAASGAPAAYVYSGRTGEPLPLLLQEDGERTHRIPGAARSVAALPDIDGDLWPDLAVGGCVRSGWDGRVLIEMEPGDWACGELGDVNADGLIDLYLSHVNEEVTVRDGRDGALIHRWSYRGGYRHGEGMTVSAPGDVDGDGVPDLGIGANEMPFFDMDPGWARVVSGATGELLWSRDAKGMTSGYDVEAIGDADGDGVGDLVLLRFSTHAVELVSCKEFETGWTVSLPDLIAGDDE